MTLPQPPFSVTLVIMNRRDGMFIECRLENGHVHQEMGPFNSFDDAKDAYDELMEKILSLSGTQLITHH